MGLADAFRSAAKIAFASAGNVKISATFKKLGSPTYNVTTGAVTESTTSTQIEVIRSDVKAYDKIGDHLDTVSGLYLILAEDLGSTVPKPQDILTVDGESKTILDVLTDPVKAVWEVGV